jgi:hypothetical protein
MDNETRRIIQDDSWDYAFLLGKSSLVLAYLEFMYTGIIELIQFTAPRGGEGILFLPWAYREGFAEAGLENYVEIQVDVTETYLELADDFDVMIVPPGIAW